MTNRASFVVACIALSLAASAVGAPPSGNETNGSNDRARASAGWRPGADGAWYGTGENFGRGWRRSADGAWYGTGQNFGRGWRRGADGAWYGTGQNFGKGWSPRR